MILPVLATFLLAGGFPSAKPVVVWGQSEHPYFLLFADRTYVAFNGNHRPQDAYDTDTLSEDEYKKLEDMLARQPDGEIVADYPPDAPRFELVWTRGSETHRFTIIGDPVGDTFPLAYPETVHKLPSEIRDVVLRKIKGHMALARYKWEPPLYEVEIKNWNAKAVSQSAKSAARRGECIWKSSLNRPGVSIVDTAVWMNLWNRPRECDGYLFDGESWNYVRLKGIAWPKSWGTWSVGY